MDLRSQISVPDLSSAPELATAALQRLLDQSAIRDLNALYAMAVDDHDIEMVLATFTENGGFTRAGSTVEGKAALRTFYEGMMDRYVTTLHIPHSHVINVDGATATGLLTGHAELSLNGTLMMAAYRYDDTYAKVDGTWLFSGRELRFMYVVPFEQMPTAFSDARRIRWPETGYAEADFPETFPTWKSHKA
jgi:uncharacterized protein (TIGR02246 family)